MEKYIIRIAQDFSSVLGGRYKKLGPHSGEAFYEEILKEKFENARLENEKLYIYLDGTGSYGSSFLDESFGKLAREKNPQEVKDTIVFRTETFGWIVDYINNVIW